jgi:hypothetical protein
MKGAAFSQRIPPVQKVTTGASFSSSGRRATASGKWRKWSIPAGIALRKLPSFTS